MLSWDINAARIPLNEDCWLGINGVSQATMTAYHAGVQQYVASLSSAGIYAILDLHRSAPGSIPSTAVQAMPDADHAPAFWSSVAATFARNPAVLFDIINEPYLNNKVAPGVTNPWSCWLSGCTLDEVFEQNPAQQTVTMQWKSSGMQALVTAIRNAKATQPILVEGLGWGSDLSGWLSHEPVDPDGQLVASVHVYPSDPCGNGTEGCWTSQYAPVAQQVPIITGEIGEADCVALFINQYMQFADTAGISYLAWEWGPPQSGCTSGNGDFGLISDWSGTPTLEGADYKAHLVGLSS
jgi:hypothetical protein